jgi:hypothetical protein
MNRKFPSIIEKLHESNEFDLDKFLHCGIPFIRLDLEVPKISKTVFNETVQECSSWRSKWKMVEDNYQVKEWNGNILFGPGNWHLWMQTISDDLQFFEYDEDGLCKKHRHSQQFSWTVNESNFLKTWVNSFVKDQDLYLVNVYNIPPGGYLFPHIDNNPNPHLNKIYVALNWPDGNQFGFNGFGNLPIEPQSAWLINNYKYTHWVYNDSNENRLVMAISCNLHSVKDLIQSSWIKMLSK